MNEYSSFDEALVLSFLKLQGMAMLAISGVFSKLRSTSAIK
jgi:hypothetical protein